MTFPTSPSPSITDSSLPTQTLATDEGTIAFDDTSTGHLVICVPSIGDVRAEYRFLRPQLVEAGFRVVTMDLRGHGESSTDFSDYSSAATGADIIALSRHLQAGPSTVIGTSKAAGAAVWAATQAPGDIGSLVLISPFVRAHSGDWMQKMVMNVLLARPWGVRFWIAYFPKFYPSEKPDDFNTYRDDLKENLNESGRLGALKAMVNSPGDMETELTAISVPTLVVTGTRDPDFKDPVAEGEWIAEKTHGRALAVDGAGHYPHAEMPDRVGPEIIQFLAQSSADHGVQPAGN
ncbi:MAG: alpha/beta hydrolase [Thermomicrobiales bacterium]